MPRAEILSKQALHTLKQLHSELAGKIQASKREAEKLRTAMIQVEAVMKMLDPAFNARAISAKRRNQTNPWFKRGTLYRAILDALRRATGPTTADDLCKALLSGRSPAATRAQENNMQAAILAALRKRNGIAVIGDGRPQRWRLKGDRD